MTIAICFKCGEEKWGSLNQCGKCGQAPRTEDEQVLSVAMCDKFFDRDGLKDMADIIKSGKTPWLDAETKAALTKSLKQVHSEGSADNKKPWWKKW
jgi:hypothetical protein